MKNQSCVIGLFRGMFEKNMLTEADESSEGTANFTIENPDGNPILLDQHV